MKLLLLGPPGSGKGTIAEKLEKDFHLTSYSAGELLREEVKKGTTIGKEIAKYLQQGKLVPDQFVVEMIKLEVRGKNNYILDGFPRSLEQAKAIEGLKLSKAIFLDVPEKVVVERLSGRRVCQKGTHTYHLQYLPPKKKGFCDHDGTKLIQRKDDTPKVIRERFRVYHRSTQPVVEYYRKKKRLKVVDGSLSPEEVYRQVKKLMG